MIPGVHARAKSRANAHTDTHAAALSLLFNVVCTHIVRMHAINLYGRFRGLGGGEGRRSAQNAREKFLHLTNRDREGVARLLSFSLSLSLFFLPSPPCFVSSQAARAQAHSRCSIGEASDNETLGPGHAIESAGNIRCIG